MEATMYDDSHFHSLGGKAKSTKRPATLELESPTTLSKKQRFASILTSPDLNMLKLASPELERIIISQNGIITTTPTPTQYLFPKNVTEEQEEYVQGFVHALALLHQTTEPDPVTGGPQFQQIQILQPNSVISGLHPKRSLPHIYTTLTTSSQSSTTSSNTTTTTKLTVVPSRAKTIIRPPSVDSSNSNSYPGSSSSMSMSNKLSIKEELQMVPIDSSGSTPPLSPINLEDQEQMKLERKRYRNRIAATKCRRRKLERIAKLEEKVQELKDENTELGAVAAELREQVCSLKQEVLNHAKNGCQIMLTNAF